MNAYLQLIIGNNFPFSHVQNETLWDFSKFDVIFGRDDFRTVTFQLFELVENAIKNEVRATKGSIMFDSWTDSDTHYLGVHAVYIRRIPYI